MRIPSICLTGLDTTFESGQIRVIVSVVSNGSFPAELRLRNVTPEGQTRFAVVSKILEVGANTVGINVPLMEGGKHEVQTTLSAQYLDNGEFKEVFSSAPSVIDVPVNFEGLMVDSATFALNENTIEVYAALRSLSSPTPSPRTVSLIVRDLSLGIVTVAEKTLSGSEEVEVVGLKAEIEGGVHQFSCSLATMVDGELTEVLPVNPTRV